MATALITGASSGLGEEFAWQLAAAGRDLVLVARSGDRLHELAHNLTEATDVRVEVLVADLATGEALARVAQRVAAGATGGEPSNTSFDNDCAATGTAPIDLLINNAGYGLPAGILATDVEQEVAALDVMVKSVLVLSHTAAHAMTARGRGAILNVASVAAWLGNSSYAAHKAWVTSFTESLASQLRGTGVSATAVLPGLTHTEFHERARLGHYESLPAIAWLDAEHVVASALAAVRRKQVLVTPSVRYAAVTSVVRTLPRSWVRAASRRHRT